MAAGRITIRCTVSGEKHTREVVEKTEHRLSSFKSVFRWAEKELSQMYSDRVMASGAGTWKPLDPEYGAWKSIHFPGSPILVRSGGLLASLKKFPIHKIDDYEATFGTNVEVAKFHQYGTWKMPQRKIIFSTPEFAQRLSNKIEEHIENG